MAITEAGGGYTPIMAAGAITARPGLPERGTAGAARTRRGRGCPNAARPCAAAHETSPAHASR